MSGKLYLVPTPIGNLEDMSFRAVRILKEVDLILAEDTRTSAPLLKHFGIDKKLFSHHQHNELRLTRHHELCDTASSVVVGSGRLTPLL